MACLVKVNRHGRLAFRVYWTDPKLGPLESWEGTGLKDTPRNRRRVEAKAELINDEIEKGTFDYLKWFPEGNRAELFKPEKKKPQTVGDYYRVWIESKKPPFVRAGQARDYRDHFRRYILPAFENVELPDVTPRSLLDFRTYLQEERGLSLKSCRTIIDASFRAMMRDARKIDHLIETDPFAALDWPRLPVQKPDPFTEEERDKIINHFREKNRFYYPFVYTLFWTGMRPSEALALR